MEENPWIEDENLQRDREREKEENQKTVKRVFSQVAIGLSAMIIAVFALMEFLMPSLLGLIPVELRRDINVIFIVSALILYAVGLVTYGVLQRWVSNAPLQRVEDAQPVKLTPILTGKLVLICLAVGFIFNMVTMGINYAVNLLSHAREVREITRQYLETGYGVMPDPPSFLEVDPLLEMVGAINPMVSFLLVVVTTSIFEEMIFRKLLYDKLIGFGGKTFILVSSLLFALFHLNHRQLLYTFAVGVIFAGVMYYTRKVSYCILLHMCFNFFGTVGMHIQALPEAIEMLYGLIYLVFLVAGIVFLIKGLRSSKEWMTFEQAQIEVEKRRNIFLNPGMMIFLIITVTSIIGGAIWGIT